MGYVSALNHLLCGLFGALLAGGRGHGGGSHSAAESGIHDVPERLLKEEEQEEEEEEEEGQG